MEAPFRGSIDDVAIWSRSLSAPEIAAVYAGGNAGNNAVCGSCAQR